MKKQFYSIFFLFLFTAVSKAQEVSLDKTRIEAGRLKPDSNFVNYLIETGSVYSKSITKNDSAEVFLAEAITVAEKIGYIKGLSAARYDQAQNYFQKGKLSPSLNLLLKNEVLAIESGDSIALFNTLRIVTTIYMKIGDMNMAAATLSRRQLILDNNGIKGLKDTSYYRLSQYNSLAVYYSSKKINKPDSVRFFYGKIYGLGRNTSYANLWAQLGAGGLGGYFSMKGKYDSAAFYYTIAMATSIDGKRFDNYYDFVLALANTYQKAGQKDSAFLYAYKVYDGASKYSYLSLVASSSGLLATLYNERHKYDSAVKYMTFERLFKDSIAGQETLKSIQVLTSEQQFKQLEKQREKDAAIREYKSAIKNYFFIGGLLLLLAIIGFMYRVNKQRAKSKKEIETAYHQLKSTQAQLVQSEKMASLGELTAGIAHEIQNPLNFVNNFSEVNKELLIDMKEEIEKGNMEEVKSIAGDVISNEEKINHHGKRADAIVKGMLQHSRSSSGQKEPTNINALADEYLRLAYHGLRAKDKSFNATLKTDYDETIGNINIIPQDIGRVVLNLITNAFYVVDEKKKAAGDPGFKNHHATETYEPTVSVSTKRYDRKVEIKVKDNGNGIPQKVLDKIFQPFFTTKPTGQGTGLGLSLAYDIIKAHGGELKVETIEGEGAVFVITLPI